MNIGNLVTFGPLCTFACCINYTKVTDTDIIATHRLHHLCLFVIYHDAKISHNSTYSCPIPKLCQTTKMQLRENKICDFTIYKLILNSSVINDHDYVAYNLLLSLLHSQL